MSPEKVEEKALAWMIGEFGEKASLHFIDCSECQPVDELPYFCHHYYVDIGVAKFGPPTPPDPDSPYTKVDNLLRQVYGENLRKQLETTGFPFPPKV